MMYSPQDYWLLARLIAGYAMSSPLPTGVTPDGEKLAYRLLKLEYKDREWVLRRELPASVFRVIQAIDTETSPPRPRVEEERFQIMAADDLDKLPPLSWLIPGEILERGLCILYGESGVGKSFVALDYALRLSTSGVSVLYAPTEGEGGYQVRVQAWKQFHRKASAGRLFFLFGGVALHDEGQINELLPRIKALEPRLIILDTLAMGMAGLDENSARDTGVFMVACRRLMRELETAILLVHHTSKAGVAERGSTAIRGNADTMIKLSDADDVILVECTKTKDAAPFVPRYLQMTQVGGSLVPIPAEKGLRDDAPLTPNQRKLLMLLALEVNRDGATLRELESASGLTLGAVGKAMSNLVKKKLVDKSPYRINAEGLRAVGHGDQSDHDRTLESNFLPQKTSDRRDRRDHTQKLNRDQSDQRDQRDQRDHDDQSDQLPGFEQLTPPRKRFEYQ